MSGNSALRPQIGVTKIESIFNTHNTDLTASGVSQVYGAGGGWIPFTSGVEADLASACSDAGYLLGKFEFTAGTQTDVRIPLFDNSDPG